MDEDDWLDGTLEGQGARTDPLVDQEWTRLSTKYSDAGYREGITDGKLSTLQKGFDEGYALSAPLAAQIGALRGRLTALLQCTTSPAGNPVLADQARDLAADLSAVRRDAVLPIDLERMEHEKADEEAAGNGVRGGDFELDQNEARDLEALQVGLDSLGNQGDRWGGRRGEELLHWLSDRVEELEARAYAS